MEICTHCQVKPWPGGHQVLFVRRPGRNSCLWLFHPLLDDWGGDHWLPQIELCVPLAMVSVLLTQSGGVISSDYYHLSFKDILT